MAVRYADITETPGVGASEEQFRMLVTRYGLAAQEAAGGRVLEVACGTGIGLGFLASNAIHVTGIDIDPTNVAIARRTYATDVSVTVDLGDAQNLSFDAQTFNCVVCFEAIYYFANLASFLAECWRVLKPGGRLVLCSVNPGWSGFNPGPYATRYWVPRDLTTELHKAGFTGRYYWAFSDVRSGEGGKVKAGIRGLAVRFHLIPRTMRGKVLLKRLFCGQIRPMPTRLESNLAGPETLRDLAPDAVSFAGKVFYVVAVRSDY